MGFKALHYSKIKADEVKQDDVKGIKVRWLITKSDGAENFAMRYFEMAPEGYSPHHSHGWEHEVFILNGDCLVICGTEQKKVGPGYVVFIPPNKMHQFRNVGNEVLRFLCLVPHHE
jgi:quercetin dioxygenase-like cupin family protein